MKKLFSTIALAAFAMAGASGCSDKPAAVKDGTKDGYHPEQNKGPVAPPAKAK